MPNKTTKALTIHNKQQQKIQLQINTQGKKGKGGKKRRKERKKRRKERKRKKERRKRKRRREKGGGRTRKEAFWKFKC